MINISKDGYVFEVDFEATKKYYKSHSLCECDYCQNYYSQIKGKFPKLEKFLSQFGIDISKPDEIASIEENNLVDYISVDYTVCGKVIALDKYEIDIYDNLFLSIIITEGYASPNSQKSDYFTLKVFGIKLPYHINLYKELKIMQENYKSNPLKNINIKRPKWINKKDSMSEIYDKKTLFLEKGKLIYAHIIQANTILYKSFPPFNCPAQVLYSTEPYLIKNSDILKDIARKLYNYKDEDIKQIPDEFKKVVSAIKEEDNKSCFTQSLYVGNKKIEYKIIATMINRKLLPKRKLCGHILPVLTIEESNQIFILPKKYWTKKFKTFWINNI